MSWIAPAALGAVYALGACLAWDLARANLRHGHHAAPRLAPLIIGDGDPRFGSMTLPGEAVLHHELPVTPRRTDDLLEVVAGAHEPWQSPSLLPGGEPPWHPPLLLRRHDGDRTVSWPAPSEAEVAASRAAHGYIPELDPGPEAAAPAPGPDQDLRPGRPEGARDAGQSPARPELVVAADLGPRARAVLDGYEGRLGARKWACT